MEESKDHLSRRCPRLGGPVTFQYCRLCGEESLPCWKIFDCWWELFDIATYLSTTLSSDMFNRLVNTRPKPKVSSLIELIELAKNRAG